MRTPIIHLLKGILLMSSLFSCFGTSLYAQTGNISNPSAGESVSQTYTVTGEAAIPDSEHLWVFVSIDQFVQLGQWYPQGYAKIREGKWNIRVNFGEARDSGNYFSVMVASIKEPAHTKLTEYLNNAIKTGVWTPIHLESYIQDFAKNVTAIDTREVLRR